MRIKDIFTGDYKKFNLICYGVILAFFAFLAAKFPVGLYGDSGEFIEMHMHREPVYPLFLCLFRKIAGENNYLSVVSWAQNIINAVAAIAFIRFFEKKLKVGSFIVGVGTIVMLAPHIMTPVFSQSGLVITCGIMNEALCLPLFYTFLIFTIDYALEGKKKSLFLALLGAFLASLTRGSMMICLIAWMIVVFVRLLYESKKWYIVIIPCIALAAVMRIRSGLAIGYNYLVNGVAATEMCSNMNLVTNILYASDRESGELIEDEEARKLFYNIYDKAEADGLTYKSAEDGYYNRINHLENSHDNLKFNYILWPLEEYYEDNYGFDYVERNLFQEEKCKEIGHSLIGACLGRWLVNYTGLAVNGAVRSVAVVKPYTIVPAMVLILAALGLSIYSIVKKRHVKEAIALLIILMMLAANAAATAIFIMCLSRYMIYCFAPFYVGLATLIFEYLKEWREER